jgi:hypothetical protein
VFNLPKLIILGLVAAAIWYGYRVLKREVGRVRDQLRKIQDAKKQESEVQPLEKDEDGVYRLKDD